MNFSVPLASCTGSRNNNFNLLRIGAATAVVISHSILLTGDLNNSFAWRLGYLAVNCFFVISGLLVCRSLVARKNLASYLTARMLRIFPALVIVVVATVFIAGPALSVLGLNAYFDNPVVWQYLVKNSLLVAGEIEFYLPGIFEYNPVAGQINTPLWTLQYEIAMYAALAVVWLGCHLANRQPGTNQNDRLFRILVVTITVVCTTGYLANITQNQPTVNFVADTLRFAAMFGVGASYYLLRHRIKLSVWVFGALLLLIALCSTIRPLYILTTYLGLPYILLCLAYLPGGLLHQYNRLGDYSYGLYIIAYPVQQTLVSFCSVMRPWVLFMFTMAICLPLAAASWHFIEKPALRFKKQP